MRSLFLFFAVLLSVALPAAAEQMIGYDNDESGPPGVLSAVDPTSGAASIPTAYENCFSGINPTNTLFANSPIGFPTALTFIGEDLYGMGVTGVSPRASARWASGSARVRRRTSRSRAWPGASTTTRSTPSTTTPTPTWGSS